jgi:glycerophosphoryl diester phosphodiesterase
MHDARIDRTTSGSGRLADLDTAALRHARFPDGASIPLLVDVATAVRDRATLCVDVKEPDLGARVIDIAAQAGATVQIWSTHREVIAAASDHGIAATLISHGVMPREGIDVLVDEAAQLGAVALSFFPVDITLAVAAACKRAGLGFMSGTPNDQATWGRLASLGARALITDRPLDCRAYLARSRVA